MIIEVGIHFGYGDAARCFITFQRDDNKNTIDKSLKKLFKKVFGTPRDADEKVYHRTVIASLRRRILRHIIDCAEGKIQAIEYEHGFGEDDESYYSWDITVRTLYSYNNNWRQKDWLCFCWTSYHSDSYLPILVTGKGIKTVIEDPTLKTGDGHRAEIVIASPEEVKGRLVRKFSLSKLSDWLIFRFQAL